MARRAAIVAALALAALLVGVLPAPDGGVRPTTRTVTVAAGDYAFDPGVLRVNSGDTVTIDVVATDVVHGLYLEGYDLSVTADPGRTATLSFVADRPGSFSFRCSVACGALHPFMVGRLKVGPNWLFWRALAIAALACVAAFTVVRR